MSSAEAERVPVARSERRKPVRQKAQLRGLIVLIDGSSTTDCRIEDVSQEGARIVVNKGRLVPDHFYLLVTGKEFAYESKLAWGRSDEYGLKIIAALAMETLKTGPMQFLRRLKLERLRG